MVREIIYFIQSNGAGQYYPIVDNYPHAPEKMPSLAMAKAESIAKKQAAEIGGRIRKGESL